MALNIPSIDISTGLDSPSVRRQLCSACEQWGFFEIVGHGVDAQLQKALFESVTAFFSLAPKDKRALSRTADNFWGYYDRELTKNQVDAKEIFDVDASPAQAAGNGTVPWPAQLPTLEPVTKRWIDAMEKLAQDILNAICLALGHPGDALDHAFEGAHSSFLRLNHYPPASQRGRTAQAAHSDLGIHPHTDAGALTILAHDHVPGLQVAHKGAWHTVAASPHSMIVNIGDMLQVWSNDRFVAPQHRVLASVGQPRYSAPFFYNPTYNTVCAPLEENVALHRYRPISWREFRDKRAGGDYADIGEEVQISWFRNRLPAGEGTFR